MMDGESPNVTFQLNIPASFRFLNVVSSSITAVLEQVNGLSERDNLTYNIILAVHEVCANIVEHAYGSEDGRIQINVALNETENRLIVDLLDTGRSFDLSEMAQPDLDMAPIRGYGLFLVHELMDKVTYKPGDKKNHWRLTKKL